MTSYICCFCNHAFQKKFNLNRHLNDNKCESYKLISAVEMHERIVSLQTKIKNQTIGDNNNINSHNINNISVIVNINPVTKLDLNYIPPDKMKEMIEKYNDGHGQDHFNLLIGEYLQTVLCNKEHPENHSVKYIKKYPPTFNSKIQDSDGKTISAIKGLKDTCEILTDPILTVLKKKLDECVKKYKKDDKFDFDSYEDTIKAIHDELKKPTIKKYLSSFLQNDILNNIEMKLDINSKKKQAAAGNSSGTVVL
jgi:hypothetical protein